MKYVKITDAIEAAAIPSSTDPLWGEFLAWALDNNVTVKKGQLSVDMDDGTREYRDAYCFDYLIDSNELKAGYYLVKSRYGDELVPADAFAEMYLIGQKIDSSL